MEATAFVLGFVVLGALALRFGQDSRECIRSKEHDLAAHGMSWNDLAVDRHASELATGLRLKSPCPRLAFIERAVDCATGTLTDLPDAVRLEAQARALITDYWSDVAWTTGIVPDAAFRRVLAELAPDLAAAPVLALQHSAAVVETVEPAPATEGRERSIETPACAPIFGRAGSTLSA